MANKKQPFSWVLSKDAVGTLDTLASEIAKPGYLYCIQHVAVVDSTTAFTRVRIAVRAGSRDVLVAEQVTCIADVLYWYDVSFYITEGQRLALILDGCTASDDIKAYVSGWYSSQGEVV